MLQKRKRKFQFKYCWPIFCLTESQQSWTVWKWAQSTTTDNIHYEICMPWSQLSVKASTPSISLPARFVTTPFWHSYQRFWYKYFGESWDLSWENHESLSRIIESQFKNNMFLGLYVTTQLIWRQTPKLCITI